MHISFSPMRRDDELTVIKTGDILTINGKTYDFGPLAEGATLPREAVDSEWIVSDVERIDGKIHLTLILPHGPNPPQEVAFPDPITVSTDGPITLPGGAS
mgnify:CR=1 FL=1|jgi:hypothetical protein